jgi:FkbM family methyltransferase
MATIREMLKLYYRAWKYQRVEGVPINWMRSQLKDGDTAFDIGAHKGAYTYWMRRAVGRKGTIVAFEPQPAGSVLLQSLFDSAVRVEPMGLSDNVGEQRFFVQPQTNSVSYEASLVDKYADAQEQVIRTTTIDSYAMEHGLRPAMMKIDVEGHEWEVLQGAKSVLHTIRPFLLIEIEQRHIGWEKMQRLFAFVEAQGYRIFFFDGKLKRPVGEFNPDSHQHLPHLDTHPRRYINNFAAEPAI